MTTATLAGLVAVTCYGCGVDYAIPEILERSALERRGPDGRQIYCPNGHAWHYVGETEAEKYRRLFNEERDAAAAARGERDQLAASLRTTRGHVTRLRERAHAGTCPFGCRRHFANLERHVRSKHPGAVLEAEAVEP